MTLNFAHRNLRGQSFEGRDLNGANFAYADLRGTSFANASLKQADFRHCQAGPTHTWQICLAIVAILLVGIAVFATWMAGAVTIETIFPVFAIRSHLPRVNSIIPALFVLGTLIVFYGVLWIRGFNDALATAMMLTGSTVFMLGGLIAYLYGNNGLEAVGTGFWQHIFDQTLLWEQKTALKILGTALWRSIAALNWSLMSASCTALAVVLTGFSPWIGGLIVLESLVGTRVIFFGLSLSPEISSTSLFSVSTVMLGLSVGIIFSAGLYSGWRALKEDEHYWSIRKVAIALFSFRGTNFSGADLNHANFAYAQLTGSNFKTANIVRANFHLSHSLERSNLDNTLLQDRRVRKLLTTHRGTGKAFVGADLGGAYLAGADLTNADLTEADLCDATLTGANLEQSNLTRVQAVGTNFCHASLTGACIESWTIDPTTELEAIKCDFVYLLNDFQERRPSNGNFSVGEFTKLFQAAMHTIDLFFQHGIDWTAFALTLNQVQVENAETPLSIQSIENKGDGVVVIRVEAPVHASKRKIHEEFTQGYDSALKNLKQSYQAQLQSKDEQIALYQQQQTDLKELVHLLAGKIPLPLQPQNKTLSKRVVIKLESGDLHTGFAVSLQIGNEGELPAQEFSGRLDPASDLLWCLQQWRSAYRQNLSGYRLDVPATQVTNIGRYEYFQDCFQMAEQLKSHLNQWLNGEAFRSLKEQLLEQLNPSESIRLMLQTGDRQVQRLPFHLWDFFERYPNAELGLSCPNYERIAYQRPDKSRVKILAILGDSTGIDVACDRQILEQLPQSEVTFLVEPQRQILNDHLWEQPWDILFFAGHSGNERSQSSIDKAYLKINQTEHLSLLQLKHALRKAVKGGLKLAILNSCDGLGLALELATLHIPQTIVMREPVPDRVAQEFLKNFLTAFSQNLPFYQSVRDARDKLQGLEDEFPCATWLPSICQNPAEQLLTWNALIG